jgi:hypothetical protein
VATAVALCAGAACAVAQAPDQPPAGPLVVDRPEAAKRIVRVFDFEEKQSNPTPVPRYFFRAQEDPSLPRERKGYPSWNASELDYTVSHSGDGSVRLPVKGGSTSLLLEPGVLPIFENADYLITGWVRTEKLASAGASIAARYISSSGKPLWKTTVRSTPVRTDGEWTQVEIELPGDATGAAFIQIELLVLQPEQATEPLNPEAIVDEKTLERRKLAVWRQDFEGTAWFDDIAIVQLPRVELTLNASSGILIAPERPRLSLGVRDLTGEDLRSRVTVRDLHGNTVDELDRPLGGGRVASEWEPAITRHGWYRATLEVMNEQTRVGVTYVDFAWVPRWAGEEGVQPASRRATGDGAGRFGMVIAEIDPRVAALMPEVIRRSGAGAVTVPLWTRELTQQGIDDALALAAPAIDATVGGWGELTLSLARVPDELSAPLRIDPDDIWTLFGTDQTAWAAYMDRYLDRYGQIVRRWQLGQIGDDRLFWRGRPGDDVRRSERVLGRLVSGPIVTTPWRIDRAIPDAFLLSGKQRSGSVYTRIAALVPGDSGPEDLHTFAAHWKGLGGDKAIRPELSLVFEPARSDDTGYAERTSTFARKVIEAWAAFSIPPAPGSAAENAGGAPPAFEAEILQPWTVVGERRARLMPRPELAAWRTLAEMLSARRVLGRFPSPPGTVCYVLGPREGETTRGVLVGWNVSCDPAKAVIRNQLGTADVRVVDLFGNRERVSEEPASSGARSKGMTVQAVRLTETPVFVENVDINLVRFISEFRISPPFVKSSSEDQENALVITNPWPMLIEGRATIVQPGGFDAAQGVRDRRWTLQPRSFQFSIPPGQTQTLPFNVSFTPAEEAGMRDFVVQMELTADKNYAGLELIAPVELGLRNVQLDLAAIPGGKGAGGDPDDLVIEARILNTGKDPLTGEVAVFAPGMPRMKASVSELAPGSETTRRFPMAGSLAKLRGQRIVVSFSESDTPNRLNRAVTVE